MADVRHIENQFFGHNLAADCPISLKFCMVKQNGMAIEVTWHKMQISKIQHTRWSSFLTTLYLREKSYVAQVYAFSQ